MSLFSDETDFDWWAILMLIVIVAAIVLIWMFV